MDVKRWTKRFTNNLGETNGCHLAVFVDRRETVEYCPEKAGQVEVLPPPGLNVPEKREEML